MESLESALSILLAHTEAVGETQCLPLEAALGRVAAEAAEAAINVPPFDRSPLDGYAVRAADLAGASRETPVRLRVIGENCAGDGTVRHPAPGEAVRVMTGAVIPAECDCVIRQEDTDEGMETASFYAEVAAGRNICRAGEDVRQGTTLLRAGERITAMHLGVLSSCGVTHVTVRRPVRAALLCTGDELTPPGEPLAPGKIYDSSRAVLAARLRELGVEAAILPSVPDEPAAAAAALTKAAGNADVLLTTGGVSVGKKDIMHQVLPLAGAERLFWRVAMKPGTPLLAAMLAGRPLICLSGNPFAALACFEVFAVPVLRKASGLTETAHRRIRARLSGEFPKASPMRRLVRARFDGERVCLPTDNHSSGSLASAVGCNALIDLPAGQPPVKDGEWVEVILL